jgi:hypothetical protein
MRSHGGNLPPIIHNDSVSGGGEQGLFFWCLTHRTSPSQFPNASFFPLSSLSPPLLHSPSKSLTLQHVCGRAIPYQEIIL